MKKISIIGLLATAVISSQGAVISYTQSFGLGDVASDAAELTGSGTPLDIDAAGAYTGIYEAGDYFNGALVNGGALEMWCRTTGGNTMTFFDLGNALDIADGTSIKVDFTAVQSARDLDNGNYVIALYDGLSDVTDSGNFFTANDTALATTIVTITDASYYVGGVHAESVVLSGLSNTSGNLYLAITANDASGAATLGSIDNIAVSQIPEPATVGLVAMMGGGMLFIRRRFMI